MTWDLFSLCSNPFSEIIPVFVFECILGRKDSLKQIIFYIAFNLSYSRDKYNHNTPYIITYHHDATVYLPIYHLILKLSASQLQNKRFVTSSNQKRPKARARQILRLLLALRSQSSLCHWSPRFHMINSVFFLAGSEFTRTVNCYWILRRERNDNFVRVLKILLRYRGHSHWPRISGSNAGRNCYYYSFITRLYSSVIKEERSLKSVLIFN